MNGCHEGERDQQKPYKCNLDVLKPANVFLCGAEKQRIVIA